MEQENPIHEVVLLFHAILMTDRANLPGSLPDFYN
jgi:hypothetical protein